MRRTLLCSWLALLHIAIVRGQTEAGNSDGLACYFPFMYEGVPYTTCIDINHSKPWCATTPDYDIDKRWGECMAEDLSTLPSFDFSTSQNVTVYQGEQARLMCRINNLQGKKVTWQRKGEQYPLTVSTFSFLSNGKYSVEHDEEAEWNILINSAEINDSGVYECRVMTQTMLRVRQVRLTVQAITLGGNQTIYVSKGEELRLQCNTTSTSQGRTSAGSKMPPPEVEWFKGDGNIIHSQSLNNMVITNQVWNNIRISTLIIDKSKSSDAGVYICRNTEKAHAEVTVRVLNTVVVRGYQKRGTASKAPPKLGQVGEENGAAAVFVSSFRLLFGLLFLSLT